jgi:hypothetical protein
VASRRRPRPSSPPDRHSPVRGRRRPTRLASVAVGAVAISIALLAAVIGPARAERPGERPRQVGKNWSTPVQDAQPSGQQPSRASRDAQLPADARSRPPVGVQPNVPTSSVPLGR